MRTVGSVVGVVLSLACLVGACGGSVVESGASPSGGGASCASDAGCTSLDDVSSPLVPLCTTGALPSGTGGTITDGTYLLASQTYYAVAGGTCPRNPVSETIVIAGGCMQIAGRAYLTAPNQPAAAVRASATFTVQGATIAITPVCLSSTGSAMADLAEQTFTADGTTLTIFFHTPLAAGGFTDHAEVLTRQ